MPDITFILHKADVRQCDLHLQRCGLPTTEPQNDSEGPHPDTSLTGLELTSPAKVHSSPGRAAGPRERGRGKAGYPTPFSWGPAEEDGEEARGSALMDPIHSGGAITRSSSPQESLLPNLRLTVWTTLNTLLSASKQPFP